LGPARYNLRIVRGDDFFAKYRFTTENPETAARTPINLAGWAIESKIIKINGDTEFTLAATITDPSDGVVELFIPDFSTILFPKRNADWYLALISPSSIKTSYMAGDVFFITPGGPV
jgi:hypothetical protein